jgi:hypothetical protein
MHTHTDNGTDWAKKSPDEPLVQLEPAAVHKREEEQREREREIRESTQT